MPELGETVDLSPAAVPPPTRDGYIFAGWSYREKNPDGSGGDLRPVTGLAQYNSATEKLTLNEAFLNHAYFQPSQETAGVNVLRLYPTWEPGPTQVRVVFWTEDLTGEADDVDSRVKGATGALQVVTHHYGEDDAEYSNAGSVVLTDVRTGCTLNVAKNTGTLTYTNDAGNPVSLNLRAELAKLPTMEVTTSYKGNDSQWSLTDASGFYSLDKVVVTQADGTAQTGDNGQAANTGTTVVNLYYTRNIYQLEFIYSNIDGDGETVVALNTGGYANHDDSPDASSNNPHKVTDAAELARIPQRQVITAKYGANLRDVWPCHNDIQVYTKDNLDARFIAWTPTEGPYNAEAIRTGGTVGLTIKGDYGAMSADMIGNPANYIDIENETYSEAKAHRLYAYWSHYSPSQYRYNHCYEVPGVTREMLESEGTSMLLDGEDGNDVRNLIYLIPANSGGAVMDLLNGYNFDDLRKTRLADPDRGANGVVSDANGDYYAFRIYEGKCYALARQVNVAATNTIAMQTPSARSHMTQKNTVADHSVRWRDSDGGYGGNHIGSKEDPVQLFFYYDRTPYTIFYSVGAYDLGQKTIYYGADLSPAYNIQLESGASADGVEEDARTNGEYAVSAKNPNGWNLPENDTGEVNVCPDRNAKGTKAWAFKGWALDQAGTALLEDGDWDGVVSGNLRLYAQWEAPKYTVEFDWNGGGLAFGTDADYKIQEIAANASMRRGGLVPTLVRSGYSQDSWVITAYEINGQWHTLKPSQYQPFQIDSTITTNLRVRANWKEIEGANMYTYTVRHVLESDRTVEVAEAQRVTGSFVPGALVWGGPVKLEGKYAEYIPTQQNGSAQVPLTGKDIAPIEITYCPPTGAEAYTYRVEFVEWDGSGV
ncbi:MAG: InlB B-repeat-containing protein, partial [Oscillospiraceae bacterium]|nr:InlB B-repeat-containing protein [Oscillospiraceae bacterium]